MSSDDPAITVEISLYPFRENVEAPILDFIHALRQEPGVEVHTNAMSTQLRGRFQDVFGALQRTMGDVLAGPDQVVFVTKILNMDLEIGVIPDLG